MEVTFADSSTLLMGLLAGVAFGFLLRKGFVGRFDTIVGQFLLQDFTVIKIMFTTIVVGSVGFWAMVQVEIIESLHIKALTLYGNILGGVIFGVGMALLGLCPGTCVVALGEGTRHAIWGSIGMLFGAALYAEFYDWIKSAILEKIDLGSVTLPAYTSASPWWFVAGLVICAIVLFSVIEKFEKG